MTEGIIQEVIEKYRVRHIEDIDGLMEELQQELIKRINQTITKGFKCACVDTDEIKRTLIGDNND